MTCHQEHIGGAGTPWSSMAHKAPGVPAGEPWRWALPEKHKNAMRDPIQAFARFKVAH
ncbi:MAG: hypothetical protein I8H77_04545 [Comamonadaceae bacterium]|nr:hypothetical protein [Comamonadaceae bacterium]